MTVYKQPRGKTFRYSFRYGGKAWTGNTQQTTKEDAEAVESKIKLALRRRAGGITEFDPDETPTFTAWAAITLAYQKKFIKRPDILERTLRMVLAFWGAKPAKPRGPAAVERPERAPRPYHNLRLGHPIADATWLQKFEQWMEARGIGASARNSYLSACCDLYTCALQPQHRATTGISVNPFAGIRRSPPNTRTVTLTVDQVLALVDYATNGRANNYDNANRRHIAHALCIAALAPKLRVASILKLEWATHFDAALTTITIGDHKTSAATGAQVVPVSAQLREILDDIKAAQDPPSPYVITHRGEPVESIKTGLRTAVEAIGLKWGLRDGVTFHVMRHSIATLLANPKLVGALTERLRADVMGHTEIRTTQKYTHLDTAVQEGPHEAISAALPGLRAAATRRKPAAGSIVKSINTESHDSTISQGNRVLSFTDLGRKKRA